MFTITFIDGKKYDIKEENSVLRIQHAIPGFMQPGSKARIDANSTFDVVDDPQEIADKVSAVVKKKLGKLTLPNGNPVWFRGPSTQGPIWIPDGEKDMKTKSAVLIAGKRMFVHNTPEEVAAIVGEADGDVILPKMLWDDRQIGLPGMSDVEDWPDQER